MTKKYKIVLGGNEIGYSLLEKADVPMGVVFGDLVISNDTFSFEYLLAYCKEHNIELSEYPEDSFFQTTQSIASLKVFSPNGKEIKGIGNQLTIIKGETNEISILGIPYSLFEEEFPQHIEAYNNLY